MRFFLSILLLTLLKIFILIAKKSDMTAIFHQQATQFEKSFMSSFRVACQMFNTMFHLSTLKYEKFEPNSDADLNMHRMFIFILNVHVCF